MATVCETCGDVGYEHLLLSCADCKCAMHQYCLAKVLFDGSSLERWFCNQCLPRGGEVASLHKASNHSHSGSTVRQASTTHVESTKEARPYRNHKNRSKRSKSKSRRKKYSSRKNSFLRKHTQERSDMRPVGDKANRGDCNASNISCASGKALHSCEVIAVEISKASKDENQQVDDEHSVCTMNNDCVANRLLTRINESNLQKPWEEFEPPQGAVEELNPTRDTNCMSSGNVEIEYRKGCCVAPVLAMESQNEPSTVLDRADLDSLSKTTMKQDVLLDASDTVVELSDTVHNCVNGNPRKRRQLVLLDDADDEEEAAIVYPKGCCLKPVLAMENQNEPSTLLDCADSNSLSETTLKQDFFLEPSDTVVNPSDTVHNCVNDNPMKRRQLILLDDDDDEEKAALEYPKGCCVTPVLAMENQNEPSTLLDRADSNSLSETTLKKDVLLEASDTVVDLSDTVHTYVNDNPRKRRQLILLDDDDDEEEAAIEYPKGCCMTPVLAMENQNEPSTLVDGADSNSLSETCLKQDVLLEASDTVVDLSDTVHKCVNDNPRKRRRLILLDDDDDEEEAAIEYPKGCCMTLVLAMENQNEPSTLVDGADLNSLSETCLKQDVLLEASDTVVELSDTVHTCVNDNPRKRRRLILLDDDDDEEAADVQSEDFNHRSLECDGSLKKHRIDMEDCVEETAHTQNLNGQNFGAVKLDIMIPESSEITQPVKKQRRYTEVNEDDEDGEVIAGTSNVECALNNVLKLASEPLVAKHDPIQSRIEFDSESVNQQRCMYSQPIDEPIWSGILKINNGVFVSLVAHISTKACGLVWELSKSLQPVVEVIKLPQLEAWPKSWKASGPTDDDIALYFFPPSMSPNEESDVLVEEIIDSCAVIKAVVGVAELLIFPSTILPEQYHVCQDRHYLWGVFKHRENESDKDVLVEEQDALALVEKGEIQEHHFMDQQSGVQCESPDHGTSVVKHAVHVEDRLLTELNCEAQDRATKATMGEGLVSPGNNSLSVKLNLPEARSNCFMQPRSDPKLHAPEEVDHSEDEQNFTRPSAELGPAASSAKSVFSVEPGEVPPTTQLFGFVAARTPRAQQLIQEMVSEGTLLFSVGEDMVAIGSTVGNDTGAQVQPTPDGECPPMQERCQSIGFVPLDDDVVSDACLELFPVRQEHIGRTPRVEEASKEVDLDLSLSARSGAPLGSFL